MVGAVWPATGGWPSPSNALEKSRTASVFWVVEGLQYHADSETFELDLVAALQLRCVQWPRMREALISVSVVLVESCLDATEDDVTQRTNMKNSYRMKSVPSPDLLKKF